MDNSTIWKIIDSHFKDNPQSLVRHHTESYNDFFKNGIFQIFKEKNPIQISSRFDESINDYRSKCLMHFGGKDGKKIYFGKPIIYDDGNAHYMFPNEARLRNMTYGMTIHYDIDIEFIDILEPGEMPTTLGAQEIQHLGGGNAVEFEEHESEFEQNGGETYKTNFKTKQNQDQECDLTQDSNNSQTGGAGKDDRPKAPIKKRGQKNKALEVQMTPALAAMIREATEKSITQNTQRREITLEKIFLGKFPIMVQSDFCILSGLPREMRYSAGECKNDLGGYFIIDGKEKTVIPQEKFADNMLYIRSVKDDVYLYSAEIRSVSENASKPIRTFSVKIVAPTGKFTHNNIVVNIPNVRKPVPLFIVFRALGFISDKEIITMCLLNLDKYESMVDLFIPSVHDAGGILNQHLALQYIASLTKGKTVSHALEILSDYFLPHIGEINYIQKAYYLGYIVFRLLSVSTGLEQPTDRDNFKYKRVELVGSLLYDLFREYYSIQQKYIYIEFEKKLYYNPVLYESNLIELIQQNKNEIFKERLLESGFKKAFKGNWGAYTHTKRIGVIQDLNRLSFNSALSHLRKTNLAMDAGLKLVGPRVLHSSQWGIIDPIDTPDGGNIGLHKSLAICTYVTQGFSRIPIIHWLREQVKMKLVEECTPLILANMTKVIVNGLWAGALNDPFESVAKMKLFRRNALIPIYTSITFDIKQNTIFIYTDQGRLCRPVFYRDELTGKMSYDKPDILKLFKDGDDFSWDDLTTGFNKKKIEHFNSSVGNIYDLSELYQGITTESNPARLDRFLAKKAIIDYIDVGESENALISINTEEFEKGAESSMKYHTHSEIHESLTYGVMCNQIIFPENNPVTRNSFSCGQSKQAVSMYHTNFQVRMDKTAVILNSGQIPLVKSRFLEHINHEENPYGENAIVAIMCYTGYNVEDAILVNEGALKRGLFRTTYFSTYEAHEEKSEKDGVIADVKLTNFELNPAVTGRKSEKGYDYTHLNKYGLVKENTVVNDKVILIGMSSGNSINPEKRMDNSVSSKKGQLGVVDKTFITDGEEGERIAKVRIREERIPAIGDKMASRAGQKGTIGLVVPECDMPFTKDGLRPDLIINPHALPSRMTIGQLVECITGKACAMYGAFGECTAFNNKGSKIGVFGELLPKVGFHSSGNDVLYNGMTGQQIESEIFIGPTYYMRLKHMVKDKINFRALGPREALTKQPVSGRANDGGLRIGEMERDTVISHGASNFLRESMMERGDKYYIAVCNQTGMIAIYNPSKNLFMSPMADGPIRLNTTLDNDGFQLEHVTRFGRSFSIVSIPYTMKLLIQELQTINVQMRIITDDNIKQIESMSYSKNIDKLMFGQNVKPADVINNIKQTLGISEKPYQEKPQEKPQEQPYQEKPQEQSPLFQYQEEPYQAEQYQDYPLLNKNQATPTSEYINGWEVTDIPKNPTSEYINGWEVTDYIRPPPRPKNINPPTTPSLTPPPLTPEWVQSSPNYPPQPTTPDISPPQNSPITFSVGDIVFYRGDSIPNRQWRIKNIGDKFITIETDDSRNLEIEETIKVVTQYEIYNPAEVVYRGGDGGMIYNQNLSQGGFGLAQDGFGLAQGGMNLPQGLVHEQPFNQGSSGFTFAPTIKLVGGNDNSTNTEPVSDSSNISSNSIGNNHATQVESSKHSNNNNTGGSNTEDKKIDFNNSFVIKKMG